MKTNSSNLFAEYSAKEFSSARQRILGMNPQPLFYLLVMASLVMLPGCKKHDPPKAYPCENSKGTSTPGDKEFLDYYAGLPDKTMCELLEARAASQRYLDITNAVKDGYADISVVLPNMGYHYMKSELADLKFEPGKPEILVYNKEHDGSFTLVAVEYAVPISLTPDKAPEGFYGSKDVWEHNTVFGLWLLHAWVWHFNPSGVFTPTNPEVHVHIP